VTNKIKKLILYRKTKKQITKRKYLYSTNFAVNHSDYEAAPIGYPDL
jgi:hypothetical protein